MRPRRDDAVESPRQATGECAMAKSIEEQKKEANDAKAATAALAARLKKAADGLKKASAEATDTRKEWSAEADE
jgi:uncharacterized phage infection (PIP) family protein YhgE